MYKKGFIQFAPLVLLAVLAGITGVIVAAVQQSSVTEIRSRADSGATCYKAAVVGACPQGSYPSGANCCIDAKETPKPDEPKETPKPDDGGQGGGGGGITCGGDGYKCANATTCVLVRGEVCGNGSGAYCCNKNVDRDNCTGICGTGASSTPKTTPKPGETPAPTPGAGDGGGSGGSCPSGQWSCKGACADSGVQNLFSSHWCNAESQWMLEAGCGGGGSTPKSEGCGSAGGTGGGGGGSGPAPTPVPTQVADGSDPTSPTAPSGGSCPSGQWSCGGNCATPDVQNLFSSHWCNGQSQWMQEAGCGGSGSAPKSGGCGGTPPLGSTPVPTNAGGSCGKTANGGFACQGIGVCNQCKNGLYQLVGNTTAGCPANCRAGASTSAASSPQTTPRPTQGASATADTSSAAPAPSFVPSGFADPVKSGEDAWALCKRAGGSDFECTSQAQTAYIEAEKKLPADFYLGAWQEIKGITNAQTEANRNLVNATLKSAGVTDTNQLSATVLSKIQQSQAVIAEQLAKGYANGVTGQNLVASAQQMGSSFGTWVVRDGSFDLALRDLVQQGVISTGGVPATQTSGSSGSTYTPPPLQNPPPDCTGAKDPACGTYATDVDANGNVCTVVRGDGRWITLGCSNGTFGNATTGLVVDTCKVGGCRSNKTGNGICDFGENEKIAPGDCKAGVAAGTGQIAESTGERSTNYRDVNIASLEANTEATKERMKFIERSKGSTLSDAALERKIQGQINQLALTGRESDITAINTEFDNILRKAIVEDLVYRGYTPTEANRRASAMDEQALLTAFNNIEPKQQDLSESEEEAYTKLITKTDEQLVTECKEAGNTNCTVTAIKKELLEDIPPGLRTGIDQARQAYVDQALESLHPNYQNAFDEYLKDYKKTHPGSDDADAFADFQAEQEKVFADIQKTAVNLGIFDEEYIKKIQSGERVPTVMARDFQDVTGCQVGSTICLKSIAGVINSFNNITGGATKRGNDLVNSACFGENTNAYDCVRGGVIQGAAPATLAVAIAALPALPLAGLLSGVPVVATYGTIAAGTTALGVAGTTYSLQQTGEACAPGSIATKECGFAVGNTVFSAVSTAVGIAAFEQIAAAARVAQVAQAGVHANMAKSGAELALRGADAAVDIGTGMELAHATTQTVTGLQTANKAISLAGVGLFGAQAVDTCFGEDADQLNCAMNVAMTVASGGRFVAASLPTAQAQTAARVGQTVEYADRGLNVGQAGLACSGALSGNSAAIIDCISGIGGAGLAFGVAPGGGQRSAIDFNPNDTIESRYLQTKQDLAGLYVDPTVDTPVLKPGVDAAQVSALELQLRQTIPEFYQYKAALELARQPIDIPVGDRTLATEDVLNAQRIFDAAAAKYANIEGKTPFELASDPDYIAYQKAGQQLLEAKQLMLQEQVALRNPRGTVQKVTDGIARIFGQEPVELARLRQAQEAFKDITKTNRPGTAVYDLAKQNVFTAQIAVDSLRLPVAQRATFVAKQAELQAAKTVLSELEFRQKLLEIPNEEGAVTLARERVIQLEQALAGIPADASGNAARAYVNEALRVARERVEFIENANTQGPAQRARIAEQLVNRDIVAAQNRARVIGIDVVALVETNARRNILARIGDAFRVGPVNTSGSRVTLGSRIADAYSGLLDRIPALKEWRTQRLTTIEARRAITEGAQGLGTRIADGIAGIFLGRLNEGSTLSITNHDLYSQTRRSVDAVGVTLESQRITSDEIRLVLEANTPVDGAPLSQQRVVAEGTTIESVRQTVQTRDIELQTRSEAYKTAAEAYKANQSPETRLALDAADTAFKQAQIDAFKAKKQELILEQAEAVRDPARKAQILATTEVVLDFSALPESKRLTAELRIRALDSRINEVWKATGKLAETGVFSWKEAQIRDAFGLMSGERSLAIQPTGGGKTFTNALFMDLSFELQGKVGTYIAKDAQSPQVYAQLKTIFGDDLYYFRLGKDASGAPIDIIAQEAQMRGAKFILSEPSDVAFLIDTMKSPGITDQQTRSAYDVYKKLAASNRTIDEFPEFLNARNEWVMSFAGESAVKGSVGDQAIMTALRDGFADIGVLKEGLVGSQERVSLAGVIDKTILAPDGTVLRQARFTEDGTRKLVETLIEKNLVVDGVQTVDASGKPVKLFDGLSGDKVGQVLDVFDAIGKRDAVRLAKFEADPVLKKIYSEAILVTDAMNKSASILTSEIGSETFKTGIGSKGNIQESVKDGDIVTALSRKMLQSWVYGETKPAFGDVTVNGQTIKTNIFDLYAWDVAYRNVTGESGGFGGVTATPDMLRDVAQMAGYRIDPTQIDAINEANRQRILGGVDASGKLTGEGGRVHKDNFTSLGENGTLAKAITEYAELLPTRLKGAGGQTNTGNKHVFASNAVGGKEEVMGRFLQEPNAGKKFNYVVGAEDGKIYEVRWRGDTPEFVPADAKYANKNLSTKSTAMERILGTGIADNTIVIILEGQSIGGDFPANGDVSFTSVIDANRANVETVYQTQGRGKRTADSLIYDGMITFGSGDGGGDSVVAMNEFFTKVTDNAVTARKNLVAESVPRWLSAEANAPLYEAYVTSMEAGNVADARLVGQMLADIQTTTRGYDTNLNKTGAEFEQVLSEQATAISTKYREMLADPKYADFFGRADQAGLREKIVRDNAIGDVDIALRDSGGDISKLNLQGQGGLRGAVERVRQNLTYDQAPRYIVGDSPTLAMSKSVEDAVNGVRGDPIPVVDSESAALKLSREQTEAELARPVVGTPIDGQTVLTAHEVAGRIAAGEAVTAANRVSLLAGITVLRNTPANSPVQNTVQVQIGKSTLTVTPGQKVLIEANIPGGGTRQRTITVENAQQVQNDMNIFAATVTTQLGDSPKTNQVKVTVTDVETNQQVDQITISEGITEAEVQAMRAQSVEDVIRNAHRTDIAKRLTEQLGTEVTVEDGMGMIVAIGSLELTKAQTPNIDVTDHEKAIDTAIDVYKKAHEEMLNPDVLARSNADIRTAVSGTLLADLGAQTPSAGPSGIRVDLSGVQNTIRGLRVGNIGNAIIGAWNWLNATPTNEELIAKGIHPDTRFRGRRDGIGWAWFNATPFSAGRPDWNIYRKAFPAQAAAETVRWVLGRVFLPTNQFLIPYDIGRALLNLRKTPTAPAEEAAVDEATAALDQQMIDQIKAEIAAHPEYTQDVVPEGVIDLFREQIAVYGFDLATPEGALEALAKVEELYKKAWEEIKETPITPESSRNILEDGAIAQIQDVLIANPGLYTQDSVPSNIVELVFKSLPFFDLNTPEGRQIARDKTIELYERAWQDLTNAQAEWNAYIAAPMVTTTGRGVLVAEINKGLDGGKNPYAVGFELKDAWIRDVFGSDATNLDKKVATQELYRVIDEVVKARSNRVEPVIPEPTQVSESTEVQKVLTVKEQRILLTAQKIKEINSAPIETTYVVDDVIAELEFAYDIALTKPQKAQIGEAILRHIIGNVIQKVTSGEVTTAEGRAQIQVSVNAFSNESVKLIRREVNEKLPQVMDEIRNEQDAEEVLGVIQLLELSQPLGNFAKHLREAQEIYVRLTTVVEDDIAPSEPEAPAGATSTLEETRALLQELESTANQERLTQLLSAIKDKKDLIIPDLLALYEEFPDLQPFLTDHISEFLRAEHLLDLTKLLVVHAESSLLGRIQRYIPYLILGTEISQRAEITDNLIALLKQSLSQNQDLLHTDTQRDIVGAIAAGNNTASTRARVRALVEESTLSSVDKRVLLDPFDTQHEVLVRAVQLAVFEKTVPSVDITAMSEDQIRVWMGSLSGEQLRVIHENLVIATSYSAIYERRMTGRLPSDRIAQYGSITLELNGETGWNMHFTPSKSGPDRARALEAVRIGAADILYLLDEVEKEYQKPVDDRRTLPNRTNDVRGPTNITMARFVVQTLGFSVETFDGRRLQGDEALNYLTEEEQKSYFAITRVPVIIVHTTIDQLNTKRSDIQRYVRSAEATGSVRLQSIFAKTIGVPATLPVELQAQVSEDTDPCIGGAFRIIPQVFAQGGAGCVPVKMGEPFVVEGVTYEIPAEGWVQYPGTNGRLLPPRRFGPDKPLRSVPLNTPVTIWAASVGAAKPTEAENLVEFTVKNYVATVQTAAPVVQGNIFQRFGAWVGGQIGQFNRTVLNRDLTQRAAKMIAKPLQRAYLDAKKVGKNTFDIEKYRMGSLYVGEDLPGYASLIARLEGVYVAQGKSVEEARVEARAAFVEMQNNLSAAWTLMGSNDQMVFRPSGGTLKHPTFFDVHQDRTIIIRNAQEFTRQGGLAAQVIAKYTGESAEAVEVWKYLWMSIGGDPTGALRYTIHDNGAISDQTPGETAITAGANMSILAAELLDETTPEGAELRQNLANRTLSPVVIHGDTKRSEELARKVTIADKNVSYEAVVASSARYEATKDVSEQAPAVNITNSEFMTLLSASPDSFGSIQSLVDFMSKEQKDALDHQIVNLELVGAQAGMTVRLDFNGVDAQEIDLAGFSKSIQRIAERKDLTSEQREQFRELHREVMELVQKRLVSILDGQLGMAVGQFRGDGMVAFTLPGGKTVTEQTRVAAYMEVARSFEYALNQLSTAQTGNVFAGQFVDFIREEFSGTNRVMVKTADVRNTNVTLTFIPGVSGISVLANMSKDTESLMNAAKARLKDAGAREDGVWISIEKTRAIEPGYIEARAAEGFRVIIPETGDVAFIEPLETPVQEVPEETTSPRGPPATEQQPAYLAPPEVIIPPEVGPIAHIQGQIAQFVGGIRDGAKNQIVKIYDVIPDTAWLVSPYTEPTLADSALLDTVNVRLRGNVVEVEVFEVRQEVKKDEQAGDRPTLLLESSTLTYTQPIWKEVSTIVLAQMSDVVRDTVKVKVADFEKTLPAIDGAPAVIARGDGRVGKRGELTKDSVVIKRIADGLQTLRKDLKDTRTGLPAVRDGQVNTAVVDTAAAALTRSISRRFTITNVSIRARLEEMAGFAASEFDRKVAFYAQDPALSRETIVATVQKEVLAKYYPEITRLLGLGDGALEELSRDPLMAALAVLDIFGFPEEGAYLAPGESIRSIVASNLRLLGESEEAIAEWLASVERGSESVETSIRTADGKATEESNQLGVALLMNDFVASLGRAYTNVGVSTLMTQSTESLLTHFDEARSQAAMRISLPNIDPARREVTLVQAAYWKTVWQTHTVFVELQKQLEHPETVSIPRARATGVSAMINREMIDTYYFVARILLRTQVRMTAVWQTLVQTSYETKREGTENKLANAGASVVLTLNHPVTRDVFGYTPKLLAFLNIGRNILEGITGNPQAFAQIGKCFASRCWNDDIQSLVLDMAGLVPDEAGEIELPNFDHARDALGTPLPELDEPQITVGYALRDLFQRWAFAFVTK